MGGLSYTVSGNIASFRTPSRVPIESLKFHFLPKQASGTPTPANPIPIEGWMGVNGEHSGKNLLDTSTKAMADHYELNGITFDYNSDGSLTVNGKVSDSATTGPQYRLAQWTQKVTGNYYICANAPYAGTYNEVYIYDADLSERPKKWDGTTASQSSSTGRPLAEVQLLAGHNYSFNIRINRGTDKQYNNDKFYPMLLPAWCTDTAFEPYNGRLIPLTFPNGQTIYGGYVDPIAGKLVCEYVKIIIDGSVEFTYMSYGSVSRFQTNISDLGPQAYGNEFQMCDCLQLGNSGEEWTCWLTTPSAKFRIYAPSSINSSAAFSEYLSEHPIEFAYRIATPIEYDLTSQQVISFLDHNNFWSDANDIAEVSYPIAESKDILDVRKKIILNEPHIEKVSGPIVSFNANMEAPLKKLNISLPIIQTGEGDPSPSNIKLIYPYTNLMMYAMLKADDLVYSSDNPDVIVNFDNTITYIGPAQSEATAILTLSNDYLLKANKDYAFFWTFGNGNCRNGRQAAILRKPDGTTINAYRTTLSDPLYGACIYTIVPVLSTDTYLHSIKLFLGAGTANANIKTYLIESPNHYMGSQVDISSNNFYIGNANILDGVLTKTHKMIDMGDLDWYQFVENNGRKQALANAPDDAQIPTSKACYCELYKMYYSSVTSLPNKAMKPGVGAASRIILVRDDDNTAVDLESFVSSVRGYKFVYTLAEPIQETITPPINRSIKTFLGNAVLMNPDKSEIELEYWTH